MEDIAYTVEMLDGETFICTESQMRDGINNISIADDSSEIIFGYSLVNVKSIVKKYKLQKKKSETFCMTLFTDEYPEITADEYIEHYCNLSAEIYGHNVFSKIDRKIVERFCF